MRSRLFELDPMEQQLALQTQLTLWRDGNTVSEEEHTLQETLYFKQEVLYLLAQAGFDDVAVYGGYTHEPAGPEHTMVVFQARRHG